MVQIADPANSLLPGRSDGPDAAWATRFDAPVRGAPQGPLVGLRFAAKDNIDVAGQPTTAGYPGYA